MFLFCPDWDILGVFLGTNTLRSLFWCSLFSENLVSGVGQAILVVLAVPGPVSVCLH